MKEEAKIFFKIAEHDLNSAKNNLKIGDYKVACFYSQQAIEKYLKAFLAEKDLYDENKHKIHDLIKLTNDCLKLDRDFEQILKIKNLEKVSIYASTTRYDIETVENLTEEDAKEAIDIAEKVREFMLNKLS